MRRTTPVDGGYLPDFRSSLKAHIDPFLAPDRGTVATSTAGMESKTNTAPLRIDPIFHPVLLLPLGLRGAAGVSLRAPAGPSHDPERVPGTARGAAPVSPPANRR